jgi:hypothetical protein
MHEFKCLCVCVCARMCACVRAPVCFLYYIFITQHSSSPLYLLLHSQHSICPSTVTFLQPCVNVLRNPHPLYGPVVEGEEQLQVTNKINLF